MVTVGKHYQGDHAYDGLRQPYVFYASLISHIEIVYPYKMLYLKTQTLRGRNLGC